MKLSLREKIAYGIGAVGKDMVYVLSASYVLYYYEDVLGVDPAFMGVLLLIARIFDAINDPVMGVLVAKTKTKWGKFRPWLMGGTVLNAFVLYAMFAVPGTLSSKMTLVYASVMYILWGITYTMMDIPYWSMIPAFSNDGKEREGLATLARSCAGVGSAIATILTMKLVAMLGTTGTTVNAAGETVAVIDERLGFKWVALGISVIFVVFISITCFNIKEKSSVDMQTTSVKEMFKALVKNDQAMAVVIAIVLINTAFYITSNFVLYYFKYDISGATWFDSYTLFTAFGGGTQILSMMILYPLLRKFCSTVKTFWVGMGMAVIGYISLFVISCTNRSSLFLIFIPAFFIFGANGVLTVLTTVFLSNTVDYGEVKNGRRDESVIFSMQTFVVKLASGLAAFVVSMCLKVCDLSNNTDNVVVERADESALIIMRMTMTILPAIGLICAIIWFGKKFILTEEKVDEITRELEKQKSAGENV